MINKGFTLIELMIVVAIIGILTAITTPFYKDYTTRAYVAEALQLVLPLKIAIIDYYVQHGKLPNDMSDLDIPYKIRFGTKKVIDLGGKMERGVFFTTRCTVYLF